MDSGFAAVVIFAPMLSHGLILALSLAYLGVLFVVAFLGERGQRRWSRGRFGPITYGLSLAIYCTSWTFYGAVGRAATIGLDFALIYVGPALMIVLGWPALAKIVRVAKRENVTSIADFLGARYGKSRAVAVLVTLIAFVGVIPYLALQLQAVSTSFAAIASNVDGTGFSGSRPFWSDTALMVTLMMAAFTILFGVRHVQASEQHRGMMLAIAFESLVKLCALLAVGGFVVWGMFDGFADVATQAAAVAKSERLLDLRPSANWIALTALAGLAFLCLPRQFHVAVVEHDHPRGLHTARWLFPLYMLLINVFVIPIALAGLVRLGGTSDPDLFVLTLPLSADAHWLSVLVFIGGLSAATSMVAVACMALSGMVGNELVMPWLLQTRFGDSGHLGRLALLVRRLAVIGTLIAAYAYYRIIAGVLPLATIGIVSFCAVANFAPGLLLGLYWRRAHRFGVVAGLVGGFAVWFVAVLWPTLQPGEPRWILPAVGPLAALDPLMRGFVVGLAVNLGLLLLGSWLAKPTARDQQQAAAFVDGLAQDRSLITEDPIQPELVQLREIAARFLGESRAYAAFDGLRLGGAAALEFTERLLSGTIGAASARIVVASARHRGFWMPGAARLVLDDATKAILYNASLLRKTLDHVGLGIAVFDAKHALDVWNDRFAALTGAPLDFLATGITWEALAARTPALAMFLPAAGALTREIRLPEGTVTDLRIDPLTGGGFVVTANDVTARVRSAEALREGEQWIRIITDNVPVLIAYVDRDERYRFTNRAYQAALMVAPQQTDGRRVSEVLGAARYAKLKPYVQGVLAGRPQTFEIDFPTNDANIEVARGTYLPHFDDQGAVLGFFLLYVDITERRQAEAALRVANESLERRVEQRTAELETARARAEEANLGKTRFIAAASHDLLQPLHATRLFVGTLKERHPGEDLVAKVDLGLGAVEALLDALLDIAKLDAGAIKPAPRAVPVGPILQSLCDAFAPIAAQSGLDLRLVPSRAVIKTDPALLRRVLQNFLSNAIRYGQRPGGPRKVLFGCRRHGEMLSLEVHDCGGGIPENQQVLVFQEFTRLHGAELASGRGLGLGLAIVERIGRMLGHRIDLRSAVGKGSTFAIEVPLASDSESQHIAAAALPVEPRQLRHAPLVVCIDDDANVGEAMKSLLQAWGCTAVTERSVAAALTTVERLGREPDLLLIDLHLGDDQSDGLDAIAELRQAWGTRFLAALVTANRDAEQLARARRLGLDVLLKPVKPAQLRALIGRRSQDLTA